jgi:hypothetical protein
MGSLEVFIISFLVSRKALVWFTDWMQLQRLTINQHTMKSYFHRAANQCRISRLPKLARRALKDSAFQPGLPRPLPCKGRGQIAGGDQGWGPRGGAADDCGRSPCGAAVAPSWPLRGRPPPYRGRRRAAASGRQNPSQCMMC